MSSKKLFVLVFLSLTFFFLQCAKQGMPPGGPKDLTPPEVVKTHPLKDSVRVGLDTKIEISFSERMSEKKTQDAVFVSPLPKTPFEFKWHKKRLSIYPKELLLMDKTYVVTLGTDAMDLHGNRMKSPFCFAFSTGDFIDSGFISGFVYSDKKSMSGVLILAYLLSEKEPDPSLFLPDYVTQTDEKGGYQLKNLSFGTYRLFAILDKNKDYLLDVEKELVGVTTHDVKLNSKSFRKDNMNFFLFKQDTTKPNLVECKVLNENLISVEFDELIDPRKLVNPEAYLISYEEKPEETFKIKKVYSLYKNFQKAFLITDELEPKRKYKLSVSNVEDKFENRIDPEKNFCFFTGADLPDTSRLKILATSPPDKEKIVPLGTEIKIFFEKPPEKLSVEKSFALKEKEDEKIEGNYFWDDPVTFVFVPENLLSGQKEYRLELKNKVADLAGNLLDTIPFEISFTTLNPDTLGSLSGRVEVLSEIDGKEIFIILSKIEPPKLDYQKILKKPNEFLFDSILPGTYLLSAFIDLDCDQKFDFGNPYPFLPSEPKIIYPDTLNVRSRWETEGVLFEFK